MARNIVILSISMMLNLLKIVVVDMTQITTNVNQFDS